MAMSRGRLCVAALLLGASLGASAPQDSVLVGTVTRVTDGDTVEVELSSGPITVRLGSIDAPEFDQPWAREATDALSRLVLHRSVDLAPIAQDRYDRMVAVVFLDDFNVNMHIVQEGHAWAYRQYLADPAYCRLEDEARKAGRGLWKGEAVAPWEWRHKVPVFTDYRNETVGNCVAAKGRPARSPRAAGPTTSDGRCVIKGNISKNGRIYHEPGSPNYDATRIDEGKGERWFCSASEAEAAGWRKPRN